MLSGLSPLDTLGLSVRRANQADRTKPHITVSLRGNCLFLLYSIATAMTNASSEVLRTGDYSHLIVWRVITVETKTYSVNYES